MFINSCQVKDVYLFAPVQVPIHILLAPPVAAPPNKKDQNGGKVNATVVITNALSHFRTLVGSPYSE